MSMHKILSIFLIFIIFYIFLFIPLSYSIQKPKIGIMKFDVSENVNPALQDFLYATLMDQLLMSGRYIVVDWEEIDRILQYIAKSQPNVSQEAARQQAINQLGIQKMYVGSAAKIGSTFHLNVKVLNLDLSVDRMVRESAENEDDLERATYFIAQLLMASPDEAKKIQDEKRAWKKFQSEKSEKALKGFLDKFPDGIYALSAKAELDKLLSVKKIKESTRKAKKEVEIEAKKKLEELCDNIAGPWEIISEPDNKNRIFIPNGRIIIYQEGEKISFDHVTSSIGGYAETTYSGTYKDHSLNVKSRYTGLLGGSGEIKAYLENDYMTMKGSWHGLGVHGPLAIKRLDKDIDPTKYSNINREKKGMLYGCFISTISE